MRRSELPFPDSSFDVVLCQAGLMFFPDVGQALREIARVVTPEGVVALQVVGSLGGSAGRPAVCRGCGAVCRPGGDRLIGTYFVYGDVDELGALLRRCGLDVAAIRMMRFDSIDEFVTAEVEATPLAERLDGDAYRRILEDTREALASSDGCRGRDPRFRTRSHGEEALSIRRGGARVRTRPSSDGCLPNFLMLRALRRESETPSASDVEPLSWKTRAARATASVLEAASFPNHAGGRVA